MKSKTLQKADEIINGERQDQYGDPEDSFELIADYWTAYLRGMPIDPEAEFSCEDCGISVDAADVAIMLALMKIARMSGQKWHKDNAVDACGYLAILNDRIKKDNQEG